MTTSKITESEIEKFAINFLERQGYQYIYAPDIAPDSDTPERSRSMESTLRASGHATKVNSYSSL